MPTLYLHSSCGLLLLLYTIGGVLVLISGILSESFCFVYYLVIYEFLFAVFHDEGHLFFSFGVVFQPIEFATGDVFKFDVFVCCCFYSARLPAVGPIKQFVATAAFYAVVGV